jgi:two-component system OmpR family sensor kinase
VLASEVNGGDRLILAEPLAATDATLGHLVVIELSATAAALLAGVLLGWWLVRAGLHPLRQVEETAWAIAGGDLARRVPEARRAAELGRLARRSRRTPSSWSGPRTIPWTSPG